MKGLEITKGQPSITRTEANHWDQDDMAVPQWGGFTSNETMHPEGHSPFNKWLEVMNASPAVSESHRMAAIYVHDDMMTARAIAISLYGRRWEPHVIEVYDRLQQKTKEADSE